MSIRQFVDAGRAPDAGRRSAGPLSTLRRLALGLALLTAMTGLAGAWLRFELPAAMDGYTLSD